MLTKLDLIEIGKIIQKELRPIKNDIKVIIRTFDRDYVNLNKRVARVEDHLKLSPIS